MGPSRLKTWVRLLFAGYCMMMLWLLLFGRLDDEAQPWRYNLQPWDTVNRYLWVLRNSTDPIQRRYAAANLVGNVGLFIPLGVFLPLLFTRTRKLLSFVLLTVASILALELIQAATGLGTFDVDDLILNLTGIGFGFLFWCGFGKTRA